MLFLDGKKDGKEAIHIISIAHRHVAAFTNLSLKHLNEWHILNTKMRTF